MVLLVIAVTIDIVKHPRRGSWLSMIYKSLTLHLQLEWSGTRKSNWEKYLAIENNERANS